MGKIDLKDAYFSVKIFPDHKKFLRFRWRGVAYQYKALPFGLATAPRVFSKIMQEAMKILREKSIRLIQYLDDILILASSPDQLRKHTRIVAQCLQTLGFILSYKKCVFEPVQAIEFLGFKVDSLKMKILLPQLKVKSIMKECRNLLRQRTVSAHRLAHLIGKMTAAIPAILPVALHYRALQRLKNRILSYNKQNYLATGILDKESRTDLKWWSSLLQNHNGRTLVTPTASLTIESDASTKGWGVYCQGKRAGGPWQTMERKQHINLLELKSAFLALQTFVSNKTNTHVLLRIDNRTAIAYINQKGGTHSKPLSDMACNLWSWCLKRNITVQAEHIAGVENTRADLESRVFQDPCDVFHRIQTKWGQMDVDLFAARHNHQIMDYYSYRPDPGAIAVDAFSQNWSRTHPYAFPSIPTSGKNPPENETRESGGSGNNCPSLAKAAVVSITTGDDSRPTDLSPTVERSVTESIEDNPPSTEGEPSTLGRVEGVRNSLQKQEISGDAADIICSSWRKSTEKSYSSAWNKWSSWCEERNTDPFSATVAEIANFLTHQFRDGKQYSTINSYRSAISNTHPHIEGYPTGKHPIIC